jgi:hypothetical protein
MKVTLNSTGIENSVRLGQAMHRLSSICRCDDW